MDTLHITGGTPLRGEVTIGGAKNAALPLLAACLLTDEPVTLDNMPNLGDLRTMERLLSHIGVEVSHGPSTRLHAATIAQAEAPYVIVKTMRASSMILGPLLARCGQARVSLPGGCAIGARPMDLHLQALTAMGAQIDIDNGYIVATADRLHGTDFTFEKITVTGTENIMMAATLASGTTVLRNAACEPEVVNVADCLRAMGAKITGDGTPTITIEGVGTLHGCTQRVISDRIQAGTYAIAIAMTGGHAILRDVCCDDFEHLLTLMEQAGVTLDRTSDTLTVTGPERLQSVSCSTAPHPGYATDLQAQWMAAMTIGRGSCTVTETVFENRFMHVAELQRLGADIRIDGNIAHIQGVDRLQGATVMATDLRASASLVLAALAADGDTEIRRVYHIDRGYEDVEAKLRGLGANITRRSNQLISSTIS